jgi:hypothetical protein
MNIIYDHALTEENRLRLSLNDNRVFNQSLFLRQNYYVRALQVDPVHPDPHEQVPGAKHVPLFEQAGKHTAKKTT